MKIGLRGLNSEWGKLPVRRVSYSSLLRRTPSRADWHLWVSIFVSPLVTFRWTSLAVFMESWRGIWLETALLNSAACASSTTHFNVELLTRSSHCFRYWLRPALLTTVKDCFFLITEFTLSRESWKLLISRLVFIGERLEKFSNVD